MFPHILTRALGLVDTWELVEQLKDGYREGQPFDEAVVWELANRALKPKRLTAPLASRTTTGVHSI